jgi:hypothetical protein
MRILSKLKLIAGKQGQIFCPDLTCQQLVPCKITIMEQCDGVERPARDILCKINSGSGGELFNSSEAYFHITHEFDLTPCMYTVVKTGKVDITITSRSKELKHISIYTDYVESYGSIIYQEKVDHFEDVLRNVSKCGRCSKLILSFNRPVKDIHCLATAECLDKPDDWISSFDIVVSQEDTSYSLDCAGEQYAKYLDFMQLQISDGASEEVRRSEPLVLYIVAYGFPRL